MKYGAPIIATMMPAGTPVGSRITLPSVSAKTNKNAPTKIAMGKIIDGVDRQ